MKTRFLAILVCLYTLLSGNVASLRAITVVPRDFDQLVARAETVFEGTVASKTSQWTGEGSDRHIVTFVTFKVEETYKGTPAIEQTLRFLGGTVGAESMEIAEMPRFEVGQKAVLFVVGNGRQFCPLVGIGQGRFHVVKDDATGQERVRTNEGLPVVNAAELGKFDENGEPQTKRHANSNPSAAMTADDFRAEILGKVAALPR